MLPALGNSSFTEIPISAICRACFNQRHQAVARITVAVDRQDAQHVVAGCIAIHDDLVGAMTKPRMTSRPSFLRIQRTGNCRPRAAAQKIIAEAADDMIAATVARNGIPPFAAVQNVVAAVAEQPIIAIIAQHVVGLATNAADRIIPSPP